MFEYVGIVCHVTTMSHCENRRCDVAYPLNAKRVLPRFHAYAMIQAVSGKDKANVVREWFWQHQGDPVIIRAGDDGGNY